MQQTFIYNYSVRILSVSLHELKDEPYTVRLRLF